MSKIQFEAGENAADLANIFSAKWLLNFLVTTTGAWPEAVTIGDFNKDGILDCAINNYMANTISVLIGTGGGNFATPVSYPVGTLPHFINSADLNKDGNLDLITANDGSNDVSVLFGNGTGTFAAAVSLTVGTSPESVAVGDVDGDGNLDLVTANSVSNDLSVLLGKGTGAFGPPTSYPVGLTPFHVILAQLNGDGTLDAAVGNYGANNISVLLNVPYSPPPPGTAYLSDLAWTSATNGNGPVQRDLSNGGQTITLRGTRYAKGLGAHAYSDIQYPISNCSSFSSTVGIDDEVSGNGSVSFQVLLDGVKQYDSGVMTGVDPAKNINLSLTGKSQLDLIVSIGSTQEYDHADWANAQITCSGTVQPPTVISSVPASGATGVTLNVPINATFSAPMQVGTLTTSTVTLTRQGTSTPITGTVGYDGTTNTVTLTPAASLTASTVYTVTIKGGASGVKDSAGNTMVADFVWSFTTGTSACTPTAITPYLQVNGAAWQQTATATVAAGSVVNLGPQPLTGTWAWTGPGGFTSAQRELDGISLSSGANMFVSTYTNSNSCSSTQTFVITIPAAGGSFTLAPSPSALSVNPGSTTTDTIAVTDAGGFTGSVTLSVSGLPTGVTASFGANPTTSSSVLTFAASSSAVAGAYSVTVKGVSGSLTASTTISLVVNTSSCTPTPITPYTQVNGAAWQQTAAATVAAGSVVNLGPQPLTGTWSWTGPGGFTSSLRELDGIPLGSGTNTFVSTYLDANSCSSTQAFVITVPGAGGGFTLAPAASTLTVNPGGNGTDTITVTDVGGFTGNVTLSASGLPTGVTASPGTNPTSGSSVITFTASTSVGPGIYNVTLNGVSGTLTASATISLVVNNAGCAPATITPFVQVNGAAWQQTTTAIVPTTASTVNLGPQPFGGTWSWTGPGGFSSGQREVDAIPLVNGTNNFTAFYIDTNSCTSTQSFVVTVSSGAIFSLTSSSSILPVKQGSNLNDTIAVVPANGFAGSVNLSATGLPLPLKTDLDIKRSKA